VILTLLYLYTARNFSRLLHLETPEPVANLYTRSYYRATWVLTALDAGFWTAMRIRRKPIRDLASIIFSGYYLLSPVRAAEKVRRVRATITIDHLRVSWEKSTTPYLKFFTNLLHPAPNRFPPRPLRIPRPKDSVYQDPIDAVLYYEGTREQLAQCTKIVLDFPGGGYVAMSPRHHDDKLLAWARLTQTPVVALNYRKAPEYPYPYALHECYDAYHSIISSKGRVVGLQLPHGVRPKICITGDSAGGNFAAGVTLMVLNHSTTGPTGNLPKHAKPLPSPDGVVLIYPSLDLNMKLWMSDEDLELIRKRDTINTNREVVRKKSEYYEKTAVGHSRPPSSHGLKTAGGDLLAMSNGAANGSNTNGHINGHPNGSPSTSTSTSQPHLTLTRAPGQVNTSPHRPLSPTDEPTTLLAMTSRLSYLHDLVLTPEMMRCMIILYIGPSLRPDFQTDFFLSPIVAPDSLLSRFPPVFFLTGERDPLVDDTIVMAGRIRAAKEGVRRERRRLGLEVKGNHGDRVEVRLIQGVSHGFMQMGAVFRQARKEVARSAGWINGILGQAEEGGWESEEEEGLQGFLKEYESEEEDEDRPLEMARKVRGRKGSVRSLGSEEDLMGRRMKGLTKGLKGEGLVDLE
jgi:acetyl esterase/lipase